MLELNPFLAPNDTPGKGGGLFAEDPATTQNIVFQTRGAALTRFEEELADALMTAYAEDATELDAVASALNAQAVRDRNGASWTGESLAAELAALGNVFTPTGAAL